MALPTLQAAPVLVPGLVPGHYHCRLDELRSQMTPLDLARHLFDDNDIEKDVRQLSRQTPTKPVKSVATEKVAGYEHPTFDIPVVLNPAVIKWLDYFQGTGRKHFLRWLSRYEQYSPMIIKVMREHGLPEDLVYLAMIESGFQPVARSHAKAVGMWQFIQATGKHYGLQVDWWIDERRDPFKATMAAAQHIVDLFNQFNDWYLVAAAYNAGAAKVERAIARYKTRDFWELCKYSYLRAETRDYVPKLIAAALIAKNPDSYGFRGVQYASQWQFEMMEVNQFSDLRKIAAASKISLRELQELNPELRRPFTPANVDRYLLRVPPNSSELLLAMQEEDHFVADAKNAYIIHKVRRNETLSRIARHYGVPTASLKELNDIGHKKSLVAGMTLKVPTHVQENLRYRPAAYAAKKSFAESNRNGAIRYRVRAGDSLWSISRRFNVNVLDLKRWNKHVASNRIRPGMVLHIKKSS